jgi:hypothetical protein
MTQLNSSGYKEIMDEQNNSITNTCIIQPILYTEVFTLIRSLNEQKK